MAENKQLLLILKFYASATISLRMIKELSTMVSSSFQVLRLVELVYFYYCIRIIFSYLSPQVFDIPITI